MKSTIAIMFLAATLVAARGSTQTHTIDGSVPCKAYNDVWRQLFDAQVTMYVDDESNTYVRVGRATAYLTPKMTAQFLSLLQKAQEWTTKARADKVELTKDVGDIMRQMDTYGHRSGVSLRFVSSKEAAEVSLILKVQDFDNQFTNETALVPADQIPPLIDLVKQVPEAVKKLKENAKKGEDFR